jgi:CheY-like chemotaxis protein
MCVRAGVEPQGSARRGLALAVLSANGSPVVLVVEDEFLVQYEIVQYLRNCGFVVLEARTAEQALAICRDGRCVDILVTSHLVV